MGGAKISKAESAFLTAICTLSGCAGSKQSEYAVACEYANPIDAYFIPCTENAGSEAERRAIQDTYRGVWKTEFENIMLRMENKCEFQEDRDSLNLYAECVEDLIAASRTVLVTDWLDDYSLPPDSEGSLWGNGTRSGLNQIEAEIYRDAGMKLTDNNYVFLERDYSQEIYY